MRTRGAPGKEDERLRRRSAAFRLKHDLGKYIRFNAPGGGTPGEKKKDSAEKGRRERGEEDVEALRERLRLDVLFTRRNGATAQSAVEIWEQWKREEGPFFEREEGEGGELAAIERAMELIRSLLPDLSTLEEAQLRELDEASAVVARHSRSFYEKILSSPSSSFGVSS